MRLGRQNIDSLAKALAQVEAALFKHQFFGLELGVIQNAVDDGDEVFSAVVDNLRIPPLLRCQVGIENEAGHSDHAIERGANFMAHISEELALDAGSVFGGLAGADHCHLDLFALRDIADNGQANCLSAKFTFADIDLYRNQRAILAPVLGCKAALALPGNLRVARPRNRFSID